MYKQEVWTNKERWRTISVYPEVGTPYASVQYSWGRYDKPVTYYVEMLGSLRAAMEAAAGSGTERWYHRLRPGEVLTEVEKIRGRAQKAGFVMQGTWQA